MTPEIIDGAPAGVSGVIAARWPREVDGPGLIVNVSDTGRRKHRKMERRRAQKSAKPKPVLVPAVPDFPPGDDDSGDDNPSAGVREPRRPLPTAPSAAVAAPEPD